VERYVCVHGHFYQPPRENPWLDEVEVQDSASPFHDWNERIAFECYRANTAARVMDEKNRIASLVNNYARISFNVGPTLLSWLERKDPETYRAILEADKESRRRYGGHGSAFAQPYNHLILPLANRRDKVTQVRWGLKDFERRFGRRPEGMWLPEAAVDTETLEILAEEGVRFTVLAPRQAQRVRRFGEKAWQDCGAAVDPTRAYRAFLPSGRSLSLFFYDGPISLAVAFEGLLKSGETFAKRILSGFSQERKHVQLVHIATDGETYGHHHRFGDMALTYALRHIEEGGHARLTNYGEFLSKHPPTWEAEIADDTSWSCAHGLERWRSDCGCKSRAGWHQAWRAPLRKALDWLRDEAAPLYEAQASGLLREPWAARDAFIDLVLDNSPKAKDEFFRRHAVRALTAPERTRALKLLELQRRLMLMYTSCGWFFDDISGLETVQVLRYAARAAEDAEELFGRPFHGELAARLEAAKSNLPERQDGRRVYEQLARGSAVTPASACAQLALTSLFEDPEPKRALYAYEAELEAFTRKGAGKTRLVTGRLRLSRRTTLEERRFVFAALHLGDHAFHGGVDDAQDEEGFRALESDLLARFDRADTTGCLLLLGRRFGEKGYDIGALFLDEQRRLISRVIEAPLSEAVSAYRQLYSHHAPVLRFLKEQGLPAPKAVNTAAELALHADLRAELEKPEPAPLRAAGLVEEAERSGVRLEAEGLSVLARDWLERLAARLSKTPDDPAAVAALSAALRALRKLPFPVDLWRTQNVLVRLLHEETDPRPVFRSVEERAARARLYAEAAELLNVRAEPLPAPPALPARVV